MTRGICPDCAQLVEITPTGKPIGTWGSARYWQLIMHKKPEAAVICEASGKLI